MSMRAGGDPLIEVVPDLDALATDPRQYLMQGPLLFGPRRYWGLAAIFGVPGLVILALWWMQPGEYERLALAIALLIGSSVWLVFSLGSAGHSLFLGPDGVEIRYRDTTVFCPWDLFDVDGEVWTASGQEHPTAGVTVPTAPAAVGAVVWRKGVVELARGLKIRAPQAWILSAHELVLPGRYELRSEDVGKLLLLLGTRLGGRLAAGDLRELAVPPPAAPPEPDKQGFYTVSLTRFRLPPCCCNCAGEPERTLLITARGGFSMLGAIPGSSAGQIVQVEVPVCERCHANIYARTQGGLVRWLAWLAVGGALAGLFAPPESRALAMMMGACFGGLVGLILGTTVGTPQPLELRNYDAPTGTVRLRFRNPEVEKRYREWRTRA